jgi:hypothetical protein
MEVLPQFQKTRQKICCLKSIIVEFDQTLVPKLATFTKPKANNRYDAKCYQQLQIQINIIRCIMKCIFIIYLYSIIIVDRFSYKLGQPLNFLTSKKYARSFEKPR